MPRPNHLFVLATLGVMTATALAEPWSVKLGFPPGRRVVVIEARELGVTWEMNDASQKLMESGYLTSASAVATGPWFYDVAAWCQKHPDHDMGLSIAYTNPYAGLRWRLMTSEQGPTSLVNADGYPWQNVVQFVVNAEVEDVRRELDAQILAARTTGFTPTHLSGYFGTVFSRQDLTAVFLAASQKYWIPAPIVELTPELIERFRQEGYPVDDAMIQLIANYPLPKLDDLQVFPIADSYDRTRDNFCQLLTILPAGLTQIICRPAVETEGMKRLTPDWQQRSWTAQALTDEKVRETLASQQIILTTWREIMHRFAQGTPREVEKSEREEQAEAKSIESK